MQGTIQSLKMKWLDPLFMLVAVLAGGLLGLVVSQVPSPVLALGAVAALGVASATIASGDIGLIALVVVTYTLFSDVMIVYHNLPSTTQPFIALLAVSIMARWVWSGEQPRGWQRPLALIVLYGLAGFAALFVAKNAEYAQTEMLNYFKDSIIVVLVAILLQRGVTLRRTMWALIGSGIFLGTLSVYQQLTHTFTDNYGGFAQAAVQNIISGGTDDYRIAGPIGDPNFYAQILVVLVPLALDRFWNEKNIYLRLLAAWGLIVISLSIIFSYSRGGATGLFVVLGIMLVRRPPKPAVLLSLLAAIILVFQFLPPNYLERLQTIPEALPGLGGDVRNEVSFRGRASEAMVAWQMFLDHPILGVGPRNYQVYYQDYSRNLGLDPRREERSAHDLFLEIAAQTGVVGLLIFCFMVAVMFRGMERARQIFLAIDLPDYAAIAVAYSTGVIGYFVGALFLHAAYPRYLWLLIGIGLALLHVAQTERQALLERADPEQVG